MRALGLDTSGTKLAVALLKGEALTLRFSDERRSQGEVAESFIRDLLSEAGLTLADIDILSVVTGPGSFTGLRVGLALAQGLARGSGLKTAGYDSFSLLRSALGDEPVLVIDSLRAELYVERGQGAEMLTAEQITPHLEGRAVAGDGAHFLEQTPLECPPLAVLAARRAMADLAADKTLAPLVPFYVRPPDITGLVKS